MPLQDSLAEVRNSADSNAKPLFGEPSFMFETDYKWCDFGWSAVAMAVIVRAVLGCRFRFLSC
jgi:hypothetical protein